MSRRAYYNEHDAQKAAWLRELIKRGLIADGEVDERDIKHVDAADLRGFSQCHFFAGIGVWSYALRLAGWPDDRECWTGSCPCPSFSAAGKGEGFDDPRHLWPDWVRLIRIGKPAVIFGEQADDAIGYGWLDLVQTDLEAEAYAVGKAVLGACSVGGSDIRQRLYWMANSTERGFSVRTGEEGGSGRSCTEVNGLCAPGGLEHSERSGTEHDSQEGMGEETTANSQNGNLPRERLRTGIESESGRMAEPECLRRRGRRIDDDYSEEDQRRDSTERSGNRFTTETQRTDGRLADSAIDGRQAGSDGGEMPRWEELKEPERFHAVNGQFAANALKGFWRDADWLLCTDGFWRPVEAKPQSMADGIADDLGYLRDRGISDAQIAEAWEEIGFPLGHNSPARLMRLRGYGDAINSEVAREFITSSMEALQSLSGDATAARLSSAENC